MVQAAKVAENFIVEISPEARTLTKLLRSLDSYLLVLNKLLEKLSFLTQKQRQIFEKAILSSQRRNIVYITCSLLTGENEEHISFFLRNYPLYPFKVITLFPKFKVKMDSSELFYKKLPESLSNYSALKALSPN